MKAADGKVVKAVRDIQRAADDVKIEYTLHELKQIEK
jgi:hypothetical protein